MFHNHIIGYLEWEVKKNLEEFSGFFISLYKTKVYG